MSNINLFKLFLSYNMIDNEIEMRLNNNTAKYVSKNIDLFFSSKIHLFSQNTDILLKLLVINNKQIPLYNGYTTEYKTIVNENFTYDSINWITSTRKTTKITTSKITESNAVTQSINSFLYPWGIVIIVSISFLIILTSVLVILVIIYKRKKNRQNKQQRLILSKNHSTFNSRNGLLLATSQLSTSSASSIFSDSANNDRLSKLQAPTKHPNQNSLSNNKFSYKSDNFIQKNIFPQTGAVFVSEKPSFGCFTNSNQENNKISSANTVSSLRNVNQSLSSTNSSLMLSTNEDQLNTTTTESLKTFDSNEINILNYTSDASFNLTINNNILSKDLNEQFKKILDWYPTYDIFQDVLEDLTNIQSDNNQTNFYHETENNLYHDYYKSSKINQNLQYTYEKKIYNKDNFIEVPIQLPIDIIIDNNHNDNLQSQSFV